MVTVSDLDSQETVYRENKKINIPYVLSCQEDESFYVYLPENENIKFHTKDKQKVSNGSEFNIEFKVKNEGANEIEFTLMTDSEMPEMETKFYVYTYTADNMTFVDFDCVEYAEEAYYEWLLEQGKIDLEEYDRIIEDRHTLKEEDGTVEVEVVESMARAASSTITIRGKIQWLDTNYVYHGANEIRVEIWDEDTTSDDYITAVYTDSNGNYSVTIDNDTSILEGGYDIYIKVCARGRYVNVVNSSNVVYSVILDLGEDVSGGTIIGNVNLTRQLNVYKSFQVQQAAAMASSYIYKMRGSYLANLTIHFPDNEKGKSCYGNNNMYLLAGDYCDWDIIQHEYGHHVATRLGFDDSPGEKHAVGRNLCDDRNNKEDGIKLAWSEGWATYFAISVQQVMGASRLNIPNVGDFIKSDTVNTNSHYSIETPSFVLGEGEEGAVASVLLDIADVWNSEDSHDSLALGYNVVYNNVVKNKCVTLSEFIQKIQGVSNSRDLYLGNILSKAKVSCEVKGVNTDGAIPRFSWYAQGGSTKYTNKSYTIVFYNSSFVKIGEISVSGNVEKYTPTANQWKIVTNAIGSGRTVYWTVKVKENSSPVTGPYFSSLGKFVMP